ATFNNLSMTLAGTYALTATAGTVNTASANFNITAAAPNTVTFSTQPANTVAGATMANVVVNVKDAYNNNISGQAVSVTTTNGTLLSGTLSQNTNASGDATFNNLSMTLAGTYALTATASTVNTTSANFNITAAAPNTVTFSTQPANTVAGATMANVVVNVKDAYNNNISGQAVSVTTTNGTLLSGTLTQNTNASGDATFNDLSMTLAGTYALTATASTVNTTSANFNITAAAPNTVTFSTQPANTVAGATMAAFAVTVKDAYNNNVSGATVSVTTTNSALAVYQGGTQVTTYATANSDGSGIATFSTISMTAAGTGYAFTATSGAATPVASGAFNITVAATDHYVVVAPASVVTSTTLTRTATVKAQDVYNNDIVSASTTITMTKTNITGTPTITFTDVAGTPVANYAYTGGTMTIYFLATHDGTQPDTFTMTATDTATKYGTSGNVNVTN
ncbi:MAG: hypothetical protein AB1599_01975, partial [Planctomycetota bacterium]